METRSSTIALLHCIFWLLILHLLFDWTGLYYSFRMLFDASENEFDDAFLIIPLTISLFYWNSSFLIPRFLNRQSWGKYLVGIVSIYFLHLFIGASIFYFLEVQNFSFRFDLEGFLNDLLVFQLIVVAMSSAWSISQIAFENAALNKEAKRKQEEAELKFLTAQVNPHFLHNTLNGIYAQALEENAEKTTEMILQLSEIMRYPLKNIAKKSILLTEEVFFIEKFITLQKLRLGETYPITFTKKGDCNQIKIMPFIFIPIVENAFKYGISQKDKAPIFIHLEIKNGELIFLSKNRKMNTKEIKSHLIGIRNLEERLKLQYGNQYSLNINDGDRCYNIELRVDITSL